MYLTIKLLLRFLGHLGTHALDSPNLARLREIVVDTFAALLDAPYAARRFQIVGERRRLHREGFDGFVVTATATGPWDQALAFYGMAMG